VRNVEQIVEQIRVAAGADFAFVLTRKGRLVTHRAPREMPEVGRARLVRAAKPLSGTDRMIELTLPREELVPYGGAAPVDVYVGVVAEQAIVCVVVATWAEKIRVAPALEAGMVAIEPLLRRGLPNGRRSLPDAEPARGSPFVPERAGRSVPPESGPLVDLRPSLIPEVPRMPRLPSQPDIALGEAPLGRASMVAIRRDAVASASSPDIVVSEAPLGRESMVAIRGDLLFSASSPEITVSEGTLGRESMVAIRGDLLSSGSSPEITVTEGTLGRESMVAIDAEDKPRPSSSPDAIRVELVSLTEVDLAEGGRMTLPWVEPPADTKRAADAAVLGRKLAQPRVTIKIEEVDPRELEAGRTRKAGQG
jgi:hypothetical protein